MDMNNNVDNQQQQHIHGDILSSEVIMADSTPTNEELKQLVDFLDPLKNDQISSERFNALSNLTQTELHSQIRKLEEWAYVLGLEEVKQMEKAKLLGILAGNPNDS